jgi:alkaline phosphatase
MLKKTLSVGVLALAAAAAACAPAGQAAVPAAVPAAPAAEAPVKNVILLIGDGVGTAYWSAAKLYADSLEVQRMPVVGLVDTRSSDSRVTDSAAGATVYAIGERTYNGAIGVGSKCKGMWQADSLALKVDLARCDGRETVLEFAAKQGLGTGIVATSSVTHATPASFVAHVPYRRMQPEIASQIVAQPADVILGGGLGFFDGSLRPDKQNLMGSLCADAACLTTAAELDAYRPDDRRLVGLFAQNHPEAAPTREPTLPKLAQVALDRLSRNPKGFFLMIEGSQPDWRGHANEPIQTVIDEMLDFDRTIGVVLDFARANPGTLVVVTADHETGGLAVGERADTLTGAYTTDYHTGSMVPLFAYGPGAERFAGIQENYVVGRMLRQAVEAIR